MKKTPPEGSERSYETHPNQSSLKQEGKGVGPVSEAQDGVSGPEQDVRGWYCAKCRGRGLKMHKAGNGDSPHEKAGQEPK